MSTRQDSEHEEAFSDGNVSGAVRVGETVRRRAGPWTPAVHAFLRHLRLAGFDGCPNVFGLDQHGREMLEYIPGETVSASLDGFGGDATLIAAAHLYRRFHDAAAGFSPPSGSTWQVSVGAPTSGEIVCHNDLAPWNTVFRDDHPVALIDWDLAAPAPRSWDLAYALWRWVPLYPDARFGPPAERARRMDVFCASYGWRDPGLLLPVVTRRQRVLLDTLVSWGEAGKAGFSEMLDGGYR